MGEVCIVLHKIYNLFVLFTDELNSHYRKDEIRMSQKVR